ncbi:MAG: mandelate racemase/muconate lactonizing enzyme family protein [Chloroflexi bacterium]|nr:mandelate racemase/muconate lactonizing enzyme family protein [Chloroflexota bacterium]
MTVVRSVEAIPIGYREPNDHDRTRYVCLVKATTDDGLVGWGEATAYFPESTRAVVELVNGLRELVVGRVPTETERVWRDMRKHTWWYGNGGVASMAIAAIDLAMWDLRGKALETRVLDLLGGPVKERLAGVASGHATLEDLGALADEAARWVSTGLHGVKVGFGKLGAARLGFAHERDVEYMRRLRAAIGPDKKIMIDLGAAVQWDVAEAVRRVQAFEDHDLHWIEEPLGHWNPRGYKTLRDKTTTRIAYGEREFGVEGIERVLATGTCDVLGFDPGRAEGLTGFIHAVERVEAERTQANAHAWSTAIVTAASLAMSWATPVCRQFELKPTRDVAQYELVSNPLTHEKGWMPQPQGHGLGIDVVTEVVESMRLT